MLGTSWCSDCARSRALLERLGVDYEFVDIDQDTAGAREVETLNHGRRSVPTILFPDGRVLVEPSDEELARAIATAL